MEDTTTKPKRIYTYKNAASGRLINSYSETSPAAGFSAIAYSDDPNYQTAIGSTAIDQSFSEGAGKEVTTSPTVLSDANVRESTIPTVQNAVNNLPQDPNAAYTSSAAGATNYSSDGEVTTGEGSYDEMLKKLGASIGGTNDPMVQAELDVLKTLKAGGDAEYNATLKSIRGNYATLQSNTQRQQQAESNKVSNALLLGGGSRYAPISSSGVMSEKQRYDVETLAQLQQKEESAVATARAAHQAKDFQLAEKALGIVEKVRSEKNTLAQKIAAETAATNKKIRENDIQSSRDSAIADLLSQGINDPVQMLNMLNFDEKGKKIGDFTAKEIGDTLGQIAKHTGLGDLSKLTGEVKNFAILRENDALPENIASLPPEQQLGAYLNFIKPKKILGVGTPKAGNLITLTEAKSQGLPLSVVGMSESDVAHSFDSDSPPKWFLEKAQGEAQASVLPEKLQSLWDSYRGAYQASRESKSSTSKDYSATNYTTQATKYFKDTYGDALDEESAAALAAAVQHLVDGGASYAKAVADVVKQASE